MDSLNRQFIAHLAAGGTLLTANRRQSRIIRRLYDDAQVAAGRRCWIAADVLPLDAWLGARWQELTARDPALPTLLSDTETSWPWRQTASRYLDPTLVSVPDMAAAARRAWLQLQRYGATLDDLDNEPLTRDQRQFHQWARQVDGGLAREGWLDPGQLELAVGEHAHRLEGLPNLLMAGFDRPAPALTRLMQRIEAAGAGVAWAPAGARAGDCRVHGAADTHDETRAWLSWARQRLLAQPDARLAIVVPDLQSRRGAIERALEAHLQPELELPGTRERDRPWDLAGGEPLAAVGLAAAALDCLAGLVPRLEVSVVSRLLRSRYSPAGDDWDPRVRLDVKLRRRGVASWTLTALAAMARREGCPGIARALEATQKLLHEHAGAHPTDDWAKAFGTVLTAWGWPGEGTLGSDEYQAAEALRNRLADFARQARAAPALTLQQARSEFARMVEAPFQPERGVPSVWVLDGLEPTGVEFDGLWISGLTAAAWPLPARHEAFLPLSLQRRIGMPGVTAEDSLEQARSTVEAWCHAAAEVVFSWSRRQDDASVEPSRLIPADLSPLDAPHAFCTRSEALQQAAPLEDLPEDAAPPLAGTARGGARILDLQAKCPFRAFAELRLDARPLEEVTAGVDPRMRGNLLHAALEHAWLELREHAALARLGPDDLDALVTRCLDAAMQEQLPAEVGERARQLEWEWQDAAVRQVLDLDRRRAPFEVIATEETLSAELAGLPLQLRVDRVDRVDGGLLVLDYKTGRAATSQWRGTRPDAPQLPLYAILKGEDVAAVAFVTADPRSAALRGIGGETASLTGVEPAERFALTDAREKGFTWAEIRDRWAAWLSALARDFRGGVALVDPKLPQTCRYCHLETLCRVSPAFDSAEAEEGTHD